jgi:hypothetical protein
MKSKLVFRNLIILCLAICSGCSKDSIDEVVVSKCYIIKETDTDLPITNTRISFLSDLVCSYDGCGKATIISETSNENGEVCVSLSQLDFEKIKSVGCTWNGFYLEADAEFDLLPNLSVIYVHKY